MELDFLVIKLNALTQHSVGHFGGRFWGVKLKLMQLLLLSRQCWILVLS